LSSLTCKRRTRGNILCTAHRLEHGFPSFTATSLPCLASRRHSAATEVARHFSGHECIAARRGEWIRTAHLSMAVQWRQTVGRNE
jgi:hypothetical protein